MARKRAPRNQKTKYGFGKAKVSREVFPTCPEEEEEAEVVGPNWSSSWSGEERGLALPSSGSS